MIVITGATGKLGHHVVDQLLTKVAPNQVAVAVRDPSRAAPWQARGVHVRMADYTKPDTLGPALAGATKVLLISSNELGRRAEQHLAVLAACKKASVGLLVYTSLLRASASSLMLAEEHKHTEAGIVTSGVPFVLLRNGWYLENYTENLGPALKFGAILGSAGDGRIAAAARADYAAAAVAVLTGQGHEGRTYELAGDTPFTMRELAAEVSQQSGKPIAYRDLPPDEYRQVLAGAGVPVGMAAALVDADVGIRTGALDSSSADLSRLIGRKTTSLHDAVAAALAVRPG